jgi:hypothetical protein
VVVGNRFGIFLAKTTFWISSMIVRMTDNDDSQSISQKDLDVWSRVLAKRRKQWTRLTRTAVAEIVRVAWRKEKTRPDEDDSYKQLEWLLDEHFRRSIDAAKSPQRRRKGLQSLTELLKRIDEACMNISNMSSNTEKENASSAGSRQQSLHQRSENNGNVVQHQQGPPLQQRRPVTSSSSTSLEASIAAKRTTVSSKEKERAAVPSISKKTAEPQKTSETTPADSSLTSATTKEPAPPASDSSSTAVAASSTTSKSDTAQEAMGAPLSKSAKVAPAAMTNHVTVSDPAAKEPPAVKGKAMKKEALQILAKRPTSHTVIPPIAQDQIYQTDKKLGPPLSVWLAKDPTGSLSGALRPRSTCKVIFQNFPVTPQFMRHIVERISLWDPYWKVERAVSITTTCRIKDVENISRDNPEPVLATTTQLRLKPSEAKTIQGWGTAKTDSFAQGERRLLLRMLPLMASTSKKKRADTHLWPKGTFVQLGGSAVPIEQRRQQSHDPMEWKMMSKPLDLTANIRHPTDYHKLEICTYDSEQYVMCVAVCSYQTPDTLYDKVLNEWADRLSEEDAMSYALEMANQQTVVLDDVDHDELNSFIFTLSCPLSMQIIKTPVRGKHCTHWQCFDLRNFLEANQSVTGIRWHCPVCGNLVSCRDLLFCGLTAKMLKELEGQARPHRDRVQFYANGTWKLLDETKKRYNRKRSSEDVGRDDDEVTNGNKRAKGNGAPTEHEVIEIL